MADPPQILSVNDNEVLEKIRSEMAKVPIKLKDPEFKKITRAAFHDHLRYAEAPRMVLYKMIQANDGHWLSYPGPVLKTFREWMTSQSNAALKAEAFQAGVRFDIFARFKAAKSSIVLKDAFYIFQLEECKNDLKSLVDEILASGDCIRAAEIVSILKLYDQFELVRDSVLHALRSFKILPTSFQHQLAVPFMLSNPSPETMLDFFRGSPKDASRIVSWLDSLDLASLNRTTKMYSQANVNLTRLGSQNKHKLIEWFCSKFELDIAAVAPQLAREKECRDLVYWIGQRDSQMGELIIAFF